MKLLDASAVRRWCEAAADALDAHRTEIDDLNVFPIPDGDTGTNLALTLGSAAEAVSREDSGEAGVVVKAMARGAVLGARGNSGVIISQILRGLAEALDGAGDCDGYLFATALRRASHAAYAAVAEPVEGTILSVARAAAEAAELAQTIGHPDLEAIVTAAAEGAAEALRRTPEQLDILAKAGVVDAGGRGLVVLLDALASVVTGQTAEITLPPTAPRQRNGLEAVREAGGTEFGYEVQYLIHAADEAIEQLKPALAALGDSLAVVGTGEGVFNVHVHVNDVGAAIEAGIEAGRPHRITVIRFADQTAAEPDRQPRAGTAIVAVAPDEGLADLFRSEGVVVVQCGLTQNPSTAEVLAEILNAQASQVILLPNASAMGGVAEMAAEEARQHGISVAVVPTKSPVQGLAAVAIHDKSRRFEDDVIAMAETAAATRFAELTIAVRESITYAGRCQAGDVLGLIDGEVIEIGSGIAEVGILLIDRLVAAGGELVTILVGSADDAAQHADALERHVRSNHPSVEVSVLFGGQPHYPLLIGVE
jgi:DAK2 domain fusion protein YloV